MSRDRLPRLYRELASWFHLVTAPEEYAAEAELYRTLLVEGSRRSVRTVLELGSGGGNNASFLKRHFQLTLVDLSPEMLDISRSINPECEHLEGDMRTVRLDRSFDAVFIHDAIAYITSETDLLSVMETAFTHCRPGGVALLVPDDVREEFSQRVDHGGNDSGRRGLRYLEWIWDPDPTDTTYLADYAYLYRDEDGTVTVEHDRHICGLFPLQTWLGLLEAVGFRPEMREDPAQESAGRTLFLARRPS